MGACGIRGLRFSDGGRILLPAWARVAGPLWRPESGGSWSSLVGRDGQECEIGFGSNSFGRIEGGSLAKAADSWAI